MGNHRSPAPFRRLSAVALLAATTAGCSTGSSSTPDPTGGSLPPATSPAGDGPGEPTTVVDSESAAEKRLVRTVERAGARQVVVPEAGFGENVRAAGTYRGRYVQVHASGDAATLPVMKDPEAVAVRGADADLYSGAGGWTVRWSCAGLTYDVTSLRSMDQPASGQVAPSTEFTERLMTVLDC